MQALDTSVQLLHHKSRCDSEWVRGRNQDIGMYIFPKNWWAHHFQPFMELVLTSEAWSMLYYLCVICIHYSCVIYVTQFFCDLCYTISFMIQWMWIWKRKERSLAPSLSSSCPYSLVLFFPFPYFSSFFSLGKKKSSIPSSLEKGFIHSLYEPRSSMFLLQATISYTAALHEYCDSF